MRKSKQGDPLQLLDEITAMLDSPAEEIDSMELKKGLLHCKNRHRHHNAATHSNNGNVWLMRIRRSLMRRLAVDRLFA